MAVRAADNREGQAHRARLVVVGGLEAVLLVVHLAAQHLKGVKGLLLKDVHRQPLVHMVEVVDPVGMGKNGQAAGLANLLAHKGKARVDKAGQLLRDGRQGFFKRRHRLMEVRVIQGAGKAGAIPAAPGRGEAGLDALVDAGLLSIERKAEIVEAMK